MRNSSLILEGLHSIHHVDEAKNYKFLTNLDKDGLKRNYSAFTKKVDKFAKGMLPKMGDPNSDKGSLSMVLELDDKEAVITFYGWNKFYDSEDEFERVNSKADLERYISNLMSGLGKVSSVFASTNWTAKRSVGYARKQTIQTGPYVEVTFKTDDIADGMDESVDEELIGEAKISYKKLEDFIFTNQASVPHSWTSVGKKYSNGRKASAFTVQLDKADWGNKTIMDFLTKNGFVQDTDSVMQGCYILNL